MTVKELISVCYDTIIIYKPLDNDFMEFEDLYKGDRKDIPQDLLDKRVRNFGAKKKDVIEISIY